MNINYKHRKATARLAKVVPPSLHRHILKQYHYDRDFALRHGILCMEQNYSSPVTVSGDINTRKLGQKRDLPGIQYDDDRITRLGAELVIHAGEFPWRAFEALFSGGGRFQSLFGVHALCREMPDRLMEWFKVPADSSRSFWFIVA